MDKRAILAVAGAGKTYYLCRNIDPKKRNIILAFTNQNVSNIIRELIRGFGQVPEDTLVMTFHKFRYKFMIRPFDAFIGRAYGHEYFRSNGVSILQPPKPMINGKYNPLYKKNTILDHYVVNNAYYSDRLSELILKAKLENQTLLELACANIKRFFDCVYIDEMQDYREEDWTLLEKIVESFDSILLVGDYYQHSVSGTNNHGIPFQKGKGKSKVNVTYDQYKKDLEKLGLEVDDKALLRSRRCSQEVCNFVSQKLGLKIDSEGINSGHIVFMNDTEGIKSIIHDDAVPKLVWNQPEKYKHRAITWGYSKGDTYSSVCIILTSAYAKLCDDDFKLPISQNSINKLYVALTRSSGDVYLVTAEKYRRAMN